jgi:hypothetical protein
VGYVGSCDPVRQRGLRFQCVPNRAYPLPARHAPLPAVKGILRDNYECLCQIFDYYAGTTNTIDEFTILVRVGGVGGCSVGPTPR